MPIFTFAVLLTDKRRFLAPQRNANAKNWFIFNTFNPIKHPNRAKIIIKSFFSDII